jgi:hypothetical protein
VRANFETRTVDTIGMVRIPLRSTTYRTVAPGGDQSSRVVMRPVSWTDDWVVTSEGRVAIVRGQDYHIDWIEPNGMTRSTPKMPFDWLRITDEEKSRLADSARAAQQEMLDAARARDAARVPRPGVGAGVSFIYSTNHADGTSMSVSLDATIAAAPNDEVPDYYPPIRAGAVSADLDGNVWILPNTSTRADSGRVVYDVVNRTGELFERVQLPAGRSIAGFGPNGAVYMMWRDAAEAWHLEHATVRRP